MTINIKTRFYKFCRRNDEDIAYDSHSKHIHSNLALKYLYAVSADAVKGAVMELRSSPSIIRMITYTELLRGEYDMVCFSCHIWNIERILYLVENYKRQVQRP